MNSGVFYIYAIVSLHDRRIYVGMSQNVDQRIEQHNAGKVISTKPFVPWVKFYSLPGGPAAFYRSILINFNLSPAEVI